MPELWEDYFTPSTVADGTNQYNVVGQSGAQYAGVPIAVGIAAAIIVHLEGQKVNRNDYTYLDGILTPLVAWPNGANIEWILLA